MPYSSLAKVWISFRKMCILGPFFFDGLVTGVSHSQMLETFLFPVLNGPTIFHQDEVLPLWELQVGLLINEMFPEYWVGRDGPISWLANALISQPVIFFSMGPLKSRVYASKPAKTADVCQKIEDEVSAISIDMLEPAMEAMKSRMGCCIEHGVAFMWKLPYRNSHFMTIDNRESLGCMTLLI